jgi:hypothetical protein
MLNNLPTDISIMIINNLYLKDIINLKLMNKNFKEIIRFYSPNYDVPIKKSIKLFTELFPFIKSISIKKNYNISDDDFKYLDKIENLDMSCCYQKEITDYAFKHLLKIKKLNILQCNQNWFEGHHFTNLAFEFLINLETLYIDDNHVITDSGLKNLKNIKILQLYNCSKITNNGLSELINLKELYLYMIKITDNTFQKLNNIESLSINDSIISDDTFKYLPNLKKLKLENVKNVTCINFDKLNIEALYLSDMNIFDKDLIYLKNIKILFLYYLNIKGDGLKYLTNVEKLEIGECKINDCYLDHLYSLKKLKKITIFMCDSISEDKINELSKKLGSKFIYHKYN